MEFNAKLYVDHISIIICVNVVVFLYWKKSTKLNGILYFKSILYIMYFCCARKPGRGCKTFQFQKCFQLNIFIRYIEKEERIDFLLLLGCCVRIILQTHRTNRKQATKKKKCEKMYWWQINKNKKDEMKAQKR